MKKVIKYSSYIAVALALCCITIFGCDHRLSRPTPDPLTGFYGADIADLAKNAVITDDYKKYIETLSPDEKKYLGPVLYFEDGKGQHAVRIETDIGGKDCWYHILFYDKADKRTKVVKYFYGTYIS